MTNNFISERQSLHMIIDDGYDEDKEDSPEIHKDMHDIVDRIADRAEKEELKDELASFELPYKIQKKIKILKENLSTVFADGFLYKEEINFWDENNRCRGIEIIDRIGRSDSVCLSVKINVHESKDKAAKYIFSYEIKCPSDITNKQWQVVRLLRRKDTQTVTV